jgi:hypothetical protein
MTKRALFLMLCIAITAILISGCASFKSPTGPAPDVEINIHTENTTEAPADEEPAAEEATEPEEAEPSEDILVEPVPTKKAADYTPAEPEELLSKEESETCGCAFRWEPLCGKDGKTYYNRCLFRCFGHELEEVKSNGQCPKNLEPQKIYSDDVLREYETDKWNGGYCWRQMYRESGIRYCKNLIVNGRVNEEPSPSKGNWLDDTHLVLDRQGRAESYTIKLATGERATNEEYDLIYQPLFEAGRYKLSFWARQEAASNNDWKVKLTLKDWWNTKPMPVGVEGCYEAVAEINGDEVYIETEPTKWRQYHYEFDMPLNFTQWNSNEQESADCAEWDMMPHGYGIEAIGPTVGEALFDDFVLEKIK